MLSEDGELSEKQQSLSVEALAYLGDSVFELCVRERLVRSGLCSSDRLNRAALDYVKATAQSEAVERVLPHLSVEETATYKRGRNAGHGKNTPKSASMAEYRRATGFEVLLGWLYMDGKRDRIDEILDIGYPELPKLK